jgi:sucrose phosphorylase
MHENSKGSSLKATGNAASNLDLYQVNCTYFEALGKNELSYLMARAIQFFVPGIPQVYYVGLFAGENDMELLAKTNVGRDINRHYYTKNEIKQKFETPLICKLKELMVLRNNHQAFNGTFNFLDSDDSILTIKWVNNNDWAELYIDFVVNEIRVNFSNINGKNTISFNDF